MAGPSSLFGEGLDAELGDISLELERIEDLADSMGNTLSKGFRSAILDGRSFRSVLGDIARSFSDIALKAAFKPISMAASGLIENLFSATNPALVGVTPFAKGGVIAAPSYFPMAGGLGLAGERGAEAILPLSRGSDGRLGVAMAVQQPMTISVNVQATDARSFLGAEAEVSAMLLRAVRRGGRAS